MGPGDQADAHPELVNVGPEMIDMMLTDPVMAYPMMTRPDAERALKKHWAMLVRCRQVGARAFAEVGLNYR